MAGISERPQSTQIFISHSTKDNNFVKRLAKDLCFVLDDHNAVWYDILALAGSAWWPKIVDEIVARKVFILILSPDALKSSWVIDELLIAWRRKNSKTRAKKNVIIIHYRDCSSKIPKDLDFLYDQQWIQLLTRETYQSAFIDLLKALKIPFDTKTNDFLLKLENLDPSFLSPVIPRVTADYKAQDREEILRIISKYNERYVSEKRWKDVVACAEEALHWAPNDSYWRKLKQEALKQLDQKDHIHTSNQPLISNNRVVRENTPNHTNNNPLKQSSKTNPYPRRLQNTEYRFSQKPGSNSSASFNNKNTRRSKSNLKTSAVRQEIESSANDFPQVFKKKLPNNGYLENFAKFMAKFIHISKTSFLAICLADILLIPGIIGLWLNTQFWLVFLVAFFISLLALIIGPVTTSRLIVKITAGVFTISWTLGGWALGWLINTFINSLHGELPGTVLQMNYLIIPLVFSISAFLFSLCLHLIIAFSTNYLVNNGR